ncbi:EbsA family protein [Lacticaseibacillus mingshuiensis]|uniref:EbsA family protein n=1 Tax=Lacticaseibacillus mingshuiensis TaxID=2799574 RepID=A0ABW4CEM8_9LACO|nr:EbsA family protein [Lacticaseibacillus mingshuiensis]
MAETRRRFFVQPGWVDFIIFWGLITAGLCLSVILQMELVGYGWPSPIFIGLLVLVIALALVQILRTRLVIAPGRVVIDHLLPSSRTIIAPTDATLTVRGHQLTLVAKSCGTVRLVYLKDPAPLAAALEAVGVTVKMEKG